MDKICTIKVLMEEATTQNDTWVTPYKAWEHIATFFITNTANTNCNLKFLDLFFGKDFKQQFWLKKMKIQVVQYIEDYTKLEPVMDKLGYNVIVTNPPYSGNMIQKTFVFCNKSNTAFALLVPEWVMETQWFKKDVLSTQQIVTIEPKQRYQYEQVSNSGKRNPSFHCQFDSVWIIGGCQHLIGMNTLEENISREFVITNHCISTRKAVKCRKRKLSSEASDSDERIMPQRKKHKGTKQTLNIECKHDRDDL
eukprot:567447_1